MGMGITPLYTVDRNVHSYYYTYVMGEKFTKPSCPRIRNIYILVIYFAANFYMYDDVESAKSSTHTTKQFLPHMHMLSKG